MSKTLKTQPTPLTGTATDIGNAEIDSAKRTQPTPLTGTATVMFANNEVGTIQDTAHTPHGDGNYRGNRPNR